MIKRGILTIIGLVIGSIIVFHLINCSPKPIVQGQGIDFSGIVVDTMKNK